MAVERCSNLFKHYQLAVINNSYKVNISALPWIGLCVCVCACMYFDRHNGFLIWSRNLNNLLAYLTFVQANTSNYMQNLCAKYES